MKYQKLILLASLYLVTDWKKEKSYGRRIEGEEQSTAYMARTNPVMVLVT